MCMIRKYATNNFITKALYLVTYVSTNVLMTLTVKVTAIQALTYSY